MVIDQGRADSHGQWNIVSRRLAPGRYTIAVAAVDQNRHTTTATVAAGSKGNPLDIVPAGAQARSVSRRAALPRTFAARHPRRG